jgi:hypothetical protein
MPHSRYEIPLRVIVVTISILCYEVSLPDQRFEEEYLFRCIEGTSYVSGLHMTLMKSPTEYGSQIIGFEKTEYFARRIQNNQKLIIKNSQWLVLFFGDIFASYRFFSEYLSHISLDMLYLSFDHLIS